MAPGQTPKSEPQPEVIEEEEEFTEIQSDVHDPSPLTRSPIDGISLTPQPTRSPGARVGGIEGSPDSTSTSDPKHPIHILIYEYMNRSYTHINSKHEYMNICVYMNIRLYEYINRLYECRVPMDRGKCCMALDAWHPRWSRPSAWPQCCTASFTCRRHAYS